MKIDAVVLYCSNDERFANACLSELLKCTDMIHVITYTNFWNGDIENLDILNKTEKKFSSESCKFYRIDASQRNDIPLYWENIGRYQATQYVSIDTDFILYIDIDEIIESEKFNKIKDDLIPYDVIQFSNYWYFREPIYRANQIEYSIKMCNTSLAKKLPLVNNKGREQYYEIAGTKRFVYEPVIFHHYSWVRNKKEMLKKTKTWGHRNDKNWETIITNEFNKPFNGTDFIHNYTYKTVENIFNI